MSIEDEVEKRGELYRVGELDDFRREEKVKARGGQLSRFRVEYVHQAELLYRHGMTDEEVAEFFDVGREVIWMWRSHSPAFAEATRIGKEAADERVERALYQAAVGGKRRVEKLFHHEGNIVRTTAVEHVEPHVGAAMKWLTNRQPDKWRDRRELTGANGAPLHPVADSGRPRLSTTEIARRTIYLLQKEMDERGELPALAGPGQQQGDVVKVVEEKITHTVEE